MKKIKMNLASGTVVEKPLLTAFNGSNGSYVVLDNELNGSMGLPIILVCKLQDNKLTKIVDADEWQVVKENLKNIIGGGSVVFIDVEENISADDVYYTQLTLPVASFDELKKNYKLEDSAEPTVEANVEEVQNENVESEQEEISYVDTEETPTVEPVVDVAVAVEEPVTFEPAIENEPVDQTETEMPSVEISTEESQPINEEVVAPVFTDFVSTQEPEVEVSMEEPTNNEPLVFVNPTEFEPPVEESNVEEPKTEETPVVEPVVETPINEEVEVKTDLESSFAEQKEIFMQACENMFDALVQKFKEELEKK